MASTVEHPTLQRRMRMPRLCWSVPQPTLMAAAGPCSLVVVSQTSQVKHPLAAADAATRQNSLTTKIPTAPAGCVVNQQHSACCSSNFD